MRVLLDQNVDHRLRTHLGSHEVFTASYRGWAALKNGKLLDATEADGFDVLCTGLLRLWTARRPARSTLWTAGASAARETSIKVEKTVLRLPIHLL